MHPQSLAGGEGKESEATEGMEIATRSKVSDQGSTERTVPKRKVSSPPHSSNGHSPSESSPSPVKKKKKPGAVNSSKDQSELRHGPFYYVKQPALTTDPVDVVPQDGRNDFYCWVCHREGQVLCCELCPRVYHAKCLKLAAEPEGDWFCPECEKITVAECIETQSKAMTMLTLDQLSFLLKFALQKMKQPGTEPFQKPVSLEQHPDYAEYIFHAMDICTLEKNIKKKMYGSTEAFLADVKWILHNCIIYNGGNHKLTATAKVIVKICEHEMNEIEVCPECYLSACQKRDNWFCEPCSNPHPLVWAKLKGFPFWPAKALRDKDGQVDARFFGQHDRAWVPINNCYLMSKEIPFSVKKTKSIFNSAMQEMEVYVENIRKKFGVFNYAPFRTPYTPDNQFQMLLDPANPSAGSVKPEKQEKIKFNFDVTASPKLLVGKSMVSSGSGTGRRISMTDMPRSPMSTNSSAHTGSDGEQETAEKGHAKAALPHYSTGEESQDCTASPASSRAGSTLESPKPFHSPAPNTPVKQEKTPTTGSILNLNLDRSKAEMDLKELSESVQQQQGAQPSLTSPKRQIRSRFQLNLDKTIESCKAQLGIDEISEDVYKGVEHSDSEESDKSDSSDSEYGSEDEQKSKNGQNNKTTAEDKKEKEPPKKKSKPSAAAGEDKDTSKESSATASTKAKAETGQKTSTPDLIAKDKSGMDSEKEPPEKLKAAPASPDAREKGKSSEEASQPASVDVDMDSDSERELVIDLGEEQAGKERKRSRKDSAAVTALKEPTASKSEGKTTPITSSLTQPQNTVLSSSPTMKDPSQSPMAVPLNIIPLTGAASSTSLTSSTLPISTASTASSSSPINTSTVKKQRPLLPRETVPVVQQAVVWNPSTKFQTSSQKWHMQKVQRQQQGQTQPATQAQVLTQVERNQQPQQQAQVSSSSSGQQASSSTRYQTRQSMKVQKDSSHTTSTSAVTLVTSTPVSATIMAGSTVSSSSTSATAGDFQIPTTSADVAADIAKYTNKIMDAIKGTMNEIYNDLTKSTSGNTIAEIRRLRIEIEKLQWLHQQELSEMKHNLELTMAEMRQSLEQERERIVAEVKKQMEMEKQQAVDETKKKQWCANCRKEAIFYCCWNTSYCDYPCQQAHWPEHMKSCTQSATSSQQEQESEGSTDVTPKAPGQPNNGPNSPRETVSSTPADKDSEVDKAKDNVTVTMS
ncbi:MYND-type zinc finger-containing chromatin reader ZMYND8 isoform X2 [Danio rerio]|uniref:MYND-type zinc finger-containing chromatin reader ZMYND8 isoform X2 n=1 Tax=Danio rerio TaxID=7955 RepID=A0A0R4ISB9_DANRE|nr:protein kinase C-binding protein 1 isoform X1 [Danio rerio]|eukprot:XP_692886.6 protein kinase C-binding protein 1 isoform X1 [Danio rerio]